MDTARVIQVIETTLLRRGKGVEDDPVRCITQYWSTEGELLAEVDTVERSSPGARVSAEELRDLQTQTGRYAT